MKSPLLFFPLIIYIILLQSCASAYYPSVVNAPVFKESNEIQASAHWGNSGIDIQGAYSFSEHLGATLNINFTDWSFIEFIEANNNHGLIEGGLGYYTFAGEKVYFSLFGGSGYSAYKRYDNDLNNERHIDGNYFKAFLQPSIGFAGDKVEGIYTFRVASIRLKDDEQIIQSILIEPTLTFNINRDFEQLVLQGGLSIPTKNTEEFSSRSNLIFFSVGYRFGAR